MTGTPPPKALNDNGRRARACPICGKPAVAAYKPFCCARCADVDLGRWFNGSYVIPGLPSETDDAVSGGSRGGAAPEEE